MQSLWFGWKDNIFPLTRWYQWDVIDALVLALYLQYHGWALESVDGWLGILKEYGFVWIRARILALEENLFRMKNWMKSICKTFLEMGVTFRDESNDGN